MTDADRGRQPERTFLSWQRTGLSFAGLGALLLHAGPSRPLSLAGGALSLAAAAGVWLHHRRPASSGSDVLPIALVATVTTLLSVLGFAIVLD